MLTEEYVDERTVSRLVGRAVQSLRNDRFDKKGLPYIKVGRSVRYKVADVRKYLDDRRVVPEKEL